MLDARKLTFGFHSQVPLLAQLSLQLERGEWLGLSGDSGAGKSTLGKLLAGLLPPQQGEIYADGKPLPTYGLRPVQWLPQSPELAVNPRWRVKKLLSEAWCPSESLMQDFGIQPDWLSRFPSALSGGELQRVCVLRALAPGVRYLIADEISTMLDPITQVELWQAVRKVADRHQLGVLVISHDTALLARLCTQRLHLVQGTLAPLTTLEAQ
ncbi:ABC transporter ATP-binding protein [Halomonas sp. TD01]|uniref:ABC transporter ATP-binding protein n=1 Tax=Halomonas sp. TD01 TaxID=999141 RepID=UPI000214E01A|nr:ATP-binding cassette domain-containing protein [Halomonas sp. TD01]EGP20534.1 ABC transporter [Halomonas sp. TD01]CAH1041579.1 Nickel ABC transporter, ATP-binding protein NikE2 (TC 3.A.1.5.3) [Halomonas sp. TD01]